jgi:hypothetical protein
MTRRTLVSSWILALTLALVASNAQAVSISMDPSATLAGPGDIVAIDINVSDLDNFSADSLGVYDIDVAYDAAKIQLNAVSFGSELSVSFASITVDTPGAGTVNLFELSLDSVADLNANQPGSFTIATLTFELIVGGTSAITPTVNAFGDASGIAIALDSVTGATISAIPEPSSAVLWMVGLLAVRQRIRKGSRR